MKKLLAFVAFNEDSANKYGLHASDNAFCGEGSNTVINFDCLSDILMLYYPNFLLIFDGDGLLLMLEQESYCH